MILIGSIFIKMFKEMNKKTYEKGQTLLFVVVAVTIALAVGISVSTRTISSLRRVTRTDTSTRVIAAAEGGIENMLGRTYSELDQAKEAANCEAIGAELQLIGSTSSCVYNFNPVDVEGGGDLISSRAVVKVETFNSNEEDGGYSFDLQPGAIREVYIPSFLYAPNTIQICWENQDSAVFYSSYNSDGDVLKGGLYPNSGFSHDGEVSGVFDSVGDAPFDRSSLGYNYCLDVNLIDNHHGLRIKVLYSDSKVVVFPTSGELPTQGYKLTSRGEIVTNEGSEEKATVIVHKTFPYAPDIFDYGIYTPGLLQ
jgi:hypothetical protein